ncbi:MAG: SMC-Scp complex subunit ScpB [Fusobacteria bacterium]|nr:SMC-Scp complex subunit ScpB [Fusobacteriota bacterium]
MQIINKIEVILFISGDAVDIKDLSDYFNMKNSEILKILYELKGEKKNSGIIIKIYDDTKVQMLTNPDYGKDIIDFFSQETKPKKLTKAALETVTIIAYKQPITKGEIEAIRGVNVEKVLTTLEEKNLIEICGKKHTIGTPNLYCVTDEFLNYIGITKICDLPSYEDVKNGTYKIE